MKTMTTPKPSLTLAAATAADLMSCNPVSLHADATIREAVDLFADRGEAFGLRRLDAAIRETAPSGAESVREGLLAAQDEFVAGAPLEDDVTLLVLAREHREG